MGNETAEQIIRAHPAAQGAAVAPRCPHFGVCGGCDLQDIPYEVQVEGKGAVVRERLAAYDGLADVPVARALGATGAWEYRNKIEMTFGRGAEGVTLGFAPKRSFHTVVDVLECAITPRRLVEVAAAARAFARERGLESYDTRSHEGLLRNLVIREGRTTGDLLINIVCASEEWPFEDWGRAMQRLQPTGVMWTLNRQMSNAVRFDAVRVMHGSEMVAERVAGLMFSYAPQSFFQTNTVMAEVLCRAVAQAAGDGEGEALDAYCGVGTFSLLVARKWEGVTGVEVALQAVADAAANAARNAINNVAFICRASEDYQWAQGQYRLVILDPPRSGCHPRLIRRLLESRPPRVIYVSCNPATLAADLARLQDAYEIESVQPIDMFPQTGHVESVAALHLRGI